MILENNFGSDTFYSLEFSWDEFIVTQRAKMFQRSNFTADAYIRLSTLSEDLTQVEVKIKYSELTWIFLILVQLGIILGSLFANEFHWLVRLVLLTGISGIWVFIVSVTYTEELKRLSKVISRLFERVHSFPMF